MYRFGKVNDTVTCMLSVIVHILNMHFEVSCISRKIHISEINCYRDGVADLTKDLLHEFCILHVNL